MGQLCTQRAHRVPPLSNVVRVNIVVFAPIHIACVRLPVSLVWSICHRKSTQTMNICRYRALVVILTLDISKAGQQLELRMNNFLCNPKNPAYRDSRISCTCLRRNRMFKQCAVQLSFFEIFASSTPLRKQSDRHTTIERQVQT